MFFQVAEMAVLGEIIYFMTFGVAAIGSTIGAFQMKFLKNN
jgi:hypothetical protein